MLWYFKNKQAYEYPNKEISNDLTDRFYKSVYGDSDEMELYYSLSYMKSNFISNLSVVFPIEELSVNYGKANDIDKDYCDQHDIHYRYENRSGGCMVLFPGNIIVQSVYPGQTFTRQHKFTHDFVDWLISKGIDASTDNNDVMIGDTKVVGTVSETLPSPFRGWIFFGIQISINADPLLIGHICTKASTKMPNALSRYGVTTEETMEWILNWFNNN